MTTEEIDTLRELATTVSMLHLPSSKVFALLDAAKQLAAARAENERLKEEVMVAHASADAEADGLNEWMEVANEFAKDLIAANPRIPELEQQLTEAERAERERW